jgi:hypothetical protein
VWESFDASDRRVFEAVAACEYARSLGEFNANNALWLRKLRDEGTVKILKFDDSLLKVMLAISKDVAAEIGSGCPPAPGPEPPRNCLSPRASTQSKRLQHTNAS